MWFPISKEVTWILSSYNSQNNEDCPELNQFHRTEAFDHFHHHDYSATSVLRVGGIILSKLYTFQNFHWSPPGKYFVTQTVRKAVMSWACFIYNAVNVFSNSSATLSRHRLRSPARHLRTMIPLCDCVQSNLYGHYQI